MLVFRTKTTFIIGAGAGYEIEMPDPREMLAKIAQGFDFSRLGSELQTRDMVILGKHFEKFARHLNTTPEKLQDAGGAIRQAARVTASIDAILEQHGHESWCRPRASWRSCSTLCRQNRALRSG